jgi:hypothetical protein
MVVLCVVVVVTSAPFSSSTRWTPSTRFAFSLATVAGRTGAGPGIQEIWTGNRAETEQKEHLERRLQTKV